MPVQPDPSQNFIHALSDFWSVFFRDTTQIETFFKGVEINLGQLYLELLETVLGTNLAHAPVFSKQYFKLFTVGEDELLFVEGDSRDTDRFVFTPQGFTLHAVPLLMNRVIAPTRVLEAVRDYEVSGGALRFRENVLDTDNLGSALEYFPVRTVTKLFPATYTDPLGRFWRYDGARTGDVFRFCLVGGVPFTAPIVGVRDDTLLLATSRPEFQGDLSRKNLQIAVLRTPFDREKRAIPPPSHPLSVVRLSAASTDGTLLVGTASFRFGGEPYARGAWAAGQAYTAGDFVQNPGGATVRALVSHASGGSYTAENWEALGAQYVYLRHPDHPAHDGLYSIDHVTGTTLVLASPPFVAATSMRAQAYLVTYPEGLIGAPHPRLQLGHSFLDAGSMSIAAHRAHPVVVDGRVYPANGTVLEGVDYLVDYERGSLTVLSGWDPRYEARLSYTWALEVVTRSHTYRGAWDGSATYLEGDIVFQPDGSTHVSRDGVTAFTPVHWRAYVAPFAFARTLPVRQLALWGADVLLDLETLYKNFGSLLAFKHPSSEQYRAFLRGVAQLFVIGPTLERFESAMNVMAELPVVRDDGEILREYDDGVLFRGTDGELIDWQEGPDGTLTASTRQFTSPTATFFASDVGARVRVRIGTGDREYLVTEVVNATTVVVSPSPPSAAGLIWRFTHVTINRRFRAPSYTFTIEDQDAAIVIEGVGTFVIEAIDNPSTVILDAPFGFQDDTGLAWSISRTKVQVVTTSRTEYVIPLGVPVREDVQQPPLWNHLTFQAFSPLTTAFRVTDYLQDPTWWHNVDIPREVAQMAGDLATRRRTSPAFIEHRLNPLDGAVVGDFGLSVGLDDEGRPGAVRSGKATWYGGGDITLDFPPTTPGATTRDIGQYVTIEAPGFRAQFRIDRIQAAMTVLHLEAFPPYEAARWVPPVEFRVTLAPLLYRRTVGFVMMDRYLKYHALRVEVAWSPALNMTVIGELIQLLKEAKPAFTHVYLSSPLDFLERLILDDHALALGAALTPRVETLYAIDATARVGPPGLLRANDAFRFVTDAQTISGAPGVYALTPTLPVGGGVRFHVVKGWFDLAVVTAGHILTEDVDYTLNRVTGTITIPSPGWVGTIPFNYVAVILRPRTAGDLDIAAGETALCVAGSDPTVWRAAAQTQDDAGLIDRAVQLTIGP